MDAGVDGVELAYAAGFVDGDGCITLKLNGKGNRVPTLSIELNAVGVDERPLVRLQHLLGGKISLRSRKPSIYQPIYGWYIRGQDAIDAIKCLAPFLTLKREQAFLAIEAWEVMQGQTYLSNRSLRGESRYNNPSDVRSVREELHERMMELNSGWRR